MPRKYARRMKPRRYMRRVKQASITTLTQPIRSMRSYSYNRNKNGYIKLLRKLPEIAVYNSALNTATLIDPTGSLQISSIGLSTGFTANTYDIGFSLKFTLNSLINASDLTTLADKYRIKGAYIRIYYNNSNSSSSTKGSMPFIQYITDHDDAVVPSSVNSLREKMGVKFKTFKNASSYIGIKCRPVVSRQIYNTGVTTAYEVPTKSVWIDCANSANAEHYGVKGIISQLYLPDPATAQSVIKFDVALVVEGKDFQ